MKNDVVYFKHINEAISKIENYLKGIDFEGFSKDDMRIDAVVRELEIISEASNNISEDFKNKHNNLPWKEIIGMRNKLIHEYFGIDINIVWQTCQKNIIKLKGIIENILE